jgi:hypothetical protein
MNRAEDAGKADADCKSGRVAHGTLLPAHKFTFAVYNLR